MSTKNAERLEALKARAKALSHAKATDATTTRKGKRAKIPTPEEKAPVAATTGRRTIVATQTPEETRKQIDALLADLRDATDAQDKKRIRRALRLRGHRGGLSHERANATVTAK